MEQEMTLNLSTQEIFSSLVERMEHKQYDDTYLWFLANFLEREPESEKGHIFYAYYALSVQNYPLALEEAEKAFRIRPVNLMVWRIFIACYQALGKTRELAYFEGLAKHFYGDALNLQLDETDAEECLNMLSLGIGIGHYAPFAGARVFYEGGRMAVRQSTFAGEYLPSLQREAWPYFVGVYLSAQESMNGNTWLLDRLKDEKKFVDCCGADFVFDIQRSHTVGQVGPVQEDCLLPIAGLQDGKVAFQREAWQSHASIRKWVYNYFRVPKGTRITADEKFVCGKPIPLHRSIGGGRPHIVLHILVDALCWKRMQELRYEPVPEIYGFFRDGVMFSDHFSVSEYTFPSFPTIATGLYPTHTQIFNENAAVALAPDILTISEQMQRLGYYTVNVMGQGTGIYTGATRGFDRLIVNSYSTAAYRGAERVIRQLEAMSDVPQYLLLHVMDAHPWNVHDFHIPFETETRLDLENRLIGEESREASVYLAQTPISEQANLEGIRHADRAIGNLLRYIRQHFDREDVLVVLTSDHGVSVYDKEPYMLSAHHLGAAFMAWGKNVPACGEVRELTSAADVYPTFAHLVPFAPPENLDGRLPRAFGGPGREYALSFSLYPGQTFKAAIRTKDVACQARTETKTDVDGTVDLSQVKCNLQSRKDGTFVTDDDVLRYFTAILEKEFSCINKKGMDWPAMKQA